MRHLFEIQDSGYPFLDGANGGVKRQQKILFSVLSLGVLIAIWIVLSYQNLSPPGLYKKGLYFDHVLRVNNIFPFINPDAEPYDHSIHSIQVAGKKIPLMYKRYISSVQVFFGAWPQLFFDEPLLGHRLVSTWVMPLVTIIGYFLVVARRFPLFAFLSTLMIIVSPFYAAPQLHILTLALSIWLFDKFLRTDSIYCLFGSVFLMALTVNIIFYFSWAFAALVLCGILFYPRLIKRLVLPVRNGVVAGLAVCLGLFNYLHYNLYRGMPTVKTLVFKLFAPEEYTKVKIDYVPSQPFLYEIKRKFRLIHSMVGSDLYVLLVAALLAVYAVLLVRAVRQSRWCAEKHRFFPILVTLVVFILILISPKTTRLRHYSFLSPFLEISFLVPMLLLARVGRLRLLRREISSRLVAVGLLVVVVFLSLASKLAAPPQGRSPAYYSTAIFGLNDYLNRHGIDGSNVVFFQWGMHSQLYFLNRGEFKINDQALRNFRLTSEQRFANFKSFFLRFPAEDPLYLPLYTSTGTHQDDTRKDLGVFLKSLDVPMIPEMDFYGEEGEKVIFLYSISLSAVKAALDRQLSAIREEGRGEQVEGRPVVVNYGPKRAVAGEGFNVQADGRSSMWVKLKEAEHSYVVWFGEMRINPKLRRENSLLTFPVEAAAIAQEAMIEVVVCDTTVEACSEPIKLRVVSEQ